MRSTQMWKRATLLTIITLGICFPIASFLWLFQPGTGKGEAVALGHWQIGGFEFQAWQVKTPYTFEPFATGLFVRRGTNRWKVFPLDIKDLYKPRLELKLEASNVFILRKGRCLGVFETENETFSKGPSKPSFIPMGIGAATEPPGEWWRVP